MNMNVNMIVNVNAIANVNVKVNENMTVSVNVNVSTVLQHFHLLYTLPAHSSHYYITVAITLNDSVDIVIISCI